MADYFFLPDLYLKKISTFITPDFFLLHIWLSVSHLPMHIDVYILHFFHFPMHSKPLLLVPQLCIWDNFLYAMMTIFVALFAFPKNSK